MSRKNIALTIFICLIILIISGISLTGFVTSPQIKEEEVKFAVRDLIKGNDKVLVEIKDSNTCYWIIPGRDENGHFIEIREYGKQYGPCLGIPRNTTYIRVDKKVNMLSQGCVCNGTYVLEQSNGGLKITKQTSIQRSMPLGIIELIQNFLKVFTKK